MSTSRRDHTTSTLVAGPGHEALLVDPAWEADELDALGREIAELGVVPTAGLATHAHVDHVLWHPSFGDVPRWASAETARLTGLGRDDALATLGADWPPDLAALYGRLTPVTGDRLPWDGPVVELVVHDAHCPGHTAAWFPDRRLLLVGDMLSDQELPLPSDQPDAIDAYRQALDRLAGYVPQAALLVPGHGTPTPAGMSRLDADRRYLDAVVSGGSVTDPRLRHPGMSEAHASTVAMAR